jgi:hypothetical protein
MLKRKLYKETKEELEKVRKAREAFEFQMSEIETIKKILVRIGEGMNKIVGVIDISQVEMELHKKIMMETAEKVEKLEKKGKPSDDVMYK